ncbi:hypothetical protein PMAC_001451 [Pneumocystis sp. 'macacae']|nr:hypothetical protein PMAC_001451 [Pneumocystis sp. 'macacae']
MSLLHDLQDEMDELAELERLEQKITLTLYEIDANFNKCHRIVTTKILPIIERYAESSRRVWEGSKFWKQFFETSANVSLSGYEELSQQDISEENGEEAGVNVSNVLNTAQGLPTDMSIVSDASIIPSDVLNPGWTSTPLDMSALHSTLPFDALDISATPSTVRIEPSPPATRVKKENPLLHRVLDASWRLQATPHRSLMLQRRSSGVSDASSPQLAFDTRDEDDDLDTSLPAGLSPPVTLQFSLPPSKLLKTPAREAARYVVDDILQTVGADTSTARRDTFGNIADSSLLSAENRRTLFEWNISSEE